MFSQFEESLLMLEIVEIFNVLVGDGYSYAYLGKDACIMKP